MQMRKVVITGLGAISPFGAGVPALMEALWGGQSAVINMKEAWESRIADLSCWIAAPLGAKLDVRTIERKYRRTMGPPAVMALLAAQEALAQAGMPPELCGSGRLGVSLASTTSSVSCMEVIFTECTVRHSLHDLPAGAFFQIMSHTAAANVAHALGVTGVTLSPNSACTSSAQAIGLAFELIRGGAQDAMICGGAEELHPIVSASLDLVQAASWHYNDQPERSPRPFDKDRDGTACGEGAGVLVLEAEEAARQRGATILGEVAGYETTTDGTHLAESHEVSIARCLQNLLDKYGLAPGEIDYINAHATGTVVGDLAEAQAIDKVFGAGTVPVSSLKGALGHTLGACCGLELIAAIEMARAGRLLPTRNLEEPGAGCEGLAHVREIQEKEIRTFIKNSFAFGGINAVLAIKRYHHE